MTIERNGYHGISHRDNSRQNIHNRNSSIYFLGLSKDNANEDVRFSKRPYTTTNRIIRTLAKTLRNLSCRDAKIMEPAKGHNLHPETEINQSKRGYPRDHKDD